MTQSLKGGSDCACLMHQLYFRLEAQSVQIKYVLQLHILFWVVKDLIRTDAFTNLGKSFAHVLYCNYSHPKIILFFIAR